MSTEHHDMQMHYLPDGYVAECTCGWQCHCDDADQAQEAWENHCDVVFMEATWRDEAS